MSRIIGAFSSDEDHVSCVCLQRGKPGNVGKASVLFPFKLHFQHGWTGINSRSQKFNVNYRLGIAGLGVVATTFHGFIVGGHKSNCWVVASYSFLFDLIFCFIVLKREATNNNQTSHTHQRVFEVKHLLLQ